MAVPVASQFTDVLWNCVLTWFYIYGFWLYSYELVCCAFPIAICGSLLLFVVLYFLRIPPPCQEVVNEILGLDPMFADERNLNENDYFMRCCAHRGAGLDAPENSLSAFNKSKDKGCTAVEFDIVLTKDQVPIVFHDPEVNRLCDASGAVEDMTWDELKDLDISLKHPYQDRYTGEKIPRLDEAIEKCLDLGLRIFLDIKGNDFKIIPFILEAFKKHKDLYKRAVVSSFNPIFIYLIRRADPQIVGSMAWRPCFFTYRNYSGVNGAETPRYSNPLKHCLAQVMDTLHTWTLDHLMYYVLGLSTILIIKDEITPKVVLRWHKRGVRPIAWTVNQPIEKQYFRRILKVTYMTDTLDSDGS